MRTPVQTTTEARPTAKLQDRQTTPSRLGAALFRGKVTALQLRRLALNLAVHRDARFARGETLAGGHIIAESVTDLWTGGGVSERALQAGKVHNLRIAVRRLDGVEIPAGKVFSFWRHVGRATRWKGYARGRELREGCLIPNVGGGLCQLSNALYDAALKAGFEIVERHAHTRIVPGSLAEVGRDATIFWNYVDLRFRSHARFRVEATLTGDRLVVRFRGERGGETASARPASRQSPAPESCESCGVEECFRIIRPKPDAGVFGRAAYLVDEFWPEFDAYIGARRTEKDLLALPLDGRRFGKANYAWTTEGFGRVRERRIATGWRAWESRRLAAQGAARQSALLRHAERLAASYARLLTYDITHVTVTQGLLPFLWRDGHLGGRTFDVLMTALPLSHLHERLDAAHALHPESTTLGDFRAEEQLVHAEAEALRNARHVVTPHAEVAALFPEKAALIDWHIPRDKARQTARAGDRVIFPAATVARKGVHELKSVALELNLKLVLTGAQLESEDFWRGVRVERAASADWLDGARVVVLPSFVEHRPRRLLEAVSRGVPVIASSACGLANVRGVVTVPPGDVRSLRDALTEILSREA